MKKVVLISGKMRSGKNQLSEFLKKEFEANGLTVSEDLFAKGVKDGCKQDFAELANVLKKIADDISLYFGEGNVPSSLLIKEDNWYENKTPITRALLQSYGTDIFRNRVDQDWWVKDLKNRLVKANVDVVLVTDVRFPNEIEGLFCDDFELFTVRVNREIGNNEYGQEHPSELALDEYVNFNYIVDNDGSLDDLMDSSRTIVSDVLTSTSILV